MKPGGAHEPVQERPRPSVLDVGVAVSRWRPEGRGMTFLMLTDVLTAY